VEIAGGIRRGEVFLVDQERLVRRLGRLSQATLTRVLAVLQEMFTP
jgi:mRNA-degrading endonuclease toxin of MazEF toxin-antitoxin module